MFGTTNDDMDYLRHDDCCLSGNPPPTKNAGRALTKALSTLSQKSATVAEFGDCRRCLAVFGDSRTFLRQCGQGLSRPAAISCHFLQLSRAKQSPQVTEPNRLRSTYAGVDWIIVAGGCCWLVAFDEVDCGNNDFEIDD